MAAPLPAPTALADAVVNHLSSTGDFIVRPTSTVMRYAKQRTDPLLAARELNVQVIVDGSIQKVGQRLRGHIQAWNAADGLLWAERGEKRKAERAIERALRGGKPVLHTHHMWHYAAMVYAEKPAPAIKLLRKAGVTGLPQLSDVPGRSTPLAAAQSSAIPAPDDRPEKRVDQLSARVFGHASQAARGRSIDRTSYAVPGASCFAARARMVRTRRSSSRAPGG